MKIHIYDTDSYHIVKCLFEDYYKLDVPNLYWYPASDTAIPGLLQRAKGVFLEHGVEIRKWSDTNAKGRMVLIRGYEYILFEYKDDAMMFKLKFIGQ